MTYLSGISLVYLAAWFNIIWFIHRGHEMQN
jgi:hypothetical protein